MPGSLNQRLKKLEDVKSHAAAIEIKVLRLDGKKLTLPMLKQFEERRVLDWFDDQNDGCWLKQGSVSAVGEWRLLGEPLGVVNCLWKEVPEWVARWLLWRWEGRRICRMALPRTYEGNDSKDGRVQVLWKHLEDPLLDYLDRSNLKQDEDDSKWLHELKSKRVCGLLSQLCKLNDSEQLFIGT